MNVHMNIQVCIAMLVQTEITGGCLTSFITALHPIYFESGFSPLQTGCLACELPGSACLCHLAPGLPVYTGSRYTGARD